jgi:tetratricopeptide (TPR) repeat protein
MLGDLNRVGGRTAESRRWYEECLDATAELHYDYLAADALCGLGLLALREGDPEAALTSFAAAMEAGRRASSPLEESRGRLGDAFALTDLGRFDEARTSFEMALRQADELDLPKARLECLAGLAELLGRRGQHRQAGELLHQVVPQLDVPHLEGTMDPGRTIRSCWRALAGFDDARADDVLRLADRWLQEMAARVGTEELRRDFLEGVPTHAELVALISDRGLTGDRAG